MKHINSNPHQNNPIKNPSLKDDHIHENFRGVITPPDEEYQSPEDCLNLVTNDGEIYKIIKDGVSEGLYELIWSNVAIKGELVGSFSGVPLLKVEEFSCTDDMAWPEFEKDDSDVDMWNEVDWDSDFSEAHL